MRYDVLIPAAYQEARTLLVLVTTSLRQDWIICAPAAFLGCGSRFSGSLSGIEPTFPVTHQHHASTRHSRQVNRAEI